jgi:hypothetical protein
MGRNFSLESQESPALELFTGGQNQQSMEGCTFEVVSGNEIASGPEADRL